MDIVVCLILNKTVYDYPVKEKKKFLMNGAMPSKDQMPWKPPQ